MKSIIYLSIVTVILLCSCKGNSFLSQRYTHFAQGNAKKQHHEPAIQESRKSASQAVAQQLISAAGNLQETPQQAMVSPAVQIPKASSLVKINTLQKVKQALENPIKAAKARAMFQEKKADAGAIQSHRGLISGLIGLILYIVLSAVVIAAIIILVLLII
jgi:flagellar basal body-associated protein FliL